MKRFFLYITLLVIGVVLLLAISTIDKNKNNATNIPTNNVQVTKTTDEQTNNLAEDGTSMANPASTYCESNGGRLEIKTDKNGGQFGLCNFEDYACEEWAYYYGNCDIESDTEAITQALIDKGLDLTNSSVKIMKHMGRDIEAGVVPNDPVGGGGYVFAIKTDDGMKILADGNGIISCDSFNGYEDFSDYLVPQCVNSNGNLIER